MSVRLSQRPNSFLSRPRLWTAGALLAVALLAGGAPAQAGPAGEWTRITEPTGANIDEEALARTPDGVLHVVWLRKNGTKLDLVHTAIGPDGRVTGEPKPVFTGWAAISNPDLIVTPDGGLRLFFGGIRTTEPAETNNSLNTATSDATGEEWKLQIGRAASSNSAYASPIGAALTRDGTPVSSWAVTTGLFVHFGLDPTKPDQQFQDACCAYEPDVATDATTGEVVLGWFSNASGQNGLYSQTIAPAAGPRLYLPGSATDDRNSALSIDQRIGIAARVGAPGVYVAYGSGYPSFTRINLWRHSGGPPLVVADGEGGAQHVNIAAGPAGRLWIMWMRANRLFVTRTNRDATRIGPIVAIDPPKETNSVYKLKGEGSPGPLDLFTRINLGTSPNTASWHTQVLVPLTLSATPTAFPAAKGGSVLFKVTDAGDPVEAATVSVAGRTLTTDARGQASMAFPKGARRTLTATAAKPGYTNASARVSAR